MLAGLVQALDSIVLAPEVVDAVDRIKTETAVHDPWGFRPNKASATFRWLIESTSIFARPSTAWRTSRQVASC